MVCQAGEIRVAEFALNSASYGDQGERPRGVKLLTRWAFGRVRLGVFCHGRVSVPLDVGEGGCSSKGVGAKVGFGYSPRTSGSSLFTKRSTSSRASATASLVRQS